ncbi:hypothetical protein OUZ56_017506 [Daphnia magna]|uniref:Uncharacterized protein n=1 Tax=Daphnia magna TaxID=35525 RepID=A0ABR0AT05_9CRUS|nr:hypothetical protein OUZ56_017506 [Daphnia magna]
MGLDLFSTSLHSSVSDFLNLPDLTQIQIIACVLKSVPNLKLEKISKIQSKSNPNQNPNPNPNHFKFEKIRSKSDPNPIQIQSNSQSIHFREERRLNAISFSRCNVRGGAKDPFDLSSRSEHPEELPCYQSQQRESMGVYFPITQGTKAQVRRTIIVRRIWTT